MMKRRCCLHRACAALLGLCLAAAVLSACDSKSRGEAQNASSADSNELTNNKESAGREPPSEEDLEAYTDDLDDEKTGPLYATIETEFGAIECRLHEERAPVTVANFVGLATGQKSWRDPETDRLMEDTPFYNGVVIHRVIPDFLIQAGDRTSTGAGGPGYTIPDEFDATLSHDRPGVLSMANKGKPDSAGSQWFITLAPAPHLDGRHAVFGQCDDLEIARQIAAMPAGPDNRPNDPPEILEITIERGDASQVDAD